MKRGEAVQGPEGPIVVCTRNDDLQAVVDATPADQRKGERLVGIWCAAGPQQWYMEGSRLAQ